MRPRLKPFVHVFRRNETQFIFCDWGKNKIHGFEASVQVANLLVLADGTYTIEDIVQRSQGLSYRQVENFFRHLQQMDIVLDENDFPPLLPTLSSKI